MGALEVEGMKEKERKKSTAHTLIAHLNLPSRYFLLLVAHFGNEGTV